MKLNAKLGQPIRMLAMLAGVGMIAWLLRFNAIPPLTFFLGLAVLGVAIFPMAKWLRERHTLLPMFELICLSLGVHMGLGAIIQPNFIAIHSELHQLDWKFIDQALLLSLFGVTSMVVVFRLASIWWRRAVPMAIDLRIKPQRRMALVLVLLATGFAGKAALFVGWVPVGQISSLLNGLILVAAVIQAIFYYRYPDNRGVSKWLLFSVVIYLTLMGLETGMLELAVIPLLLVFIVRLGCLRVLPVGVTLLALTLLLILNSVKDDYRERVWFGGEGGTTTDKFKIWGEVAAGTNLAKFFSETEAVEGRGWRESMSRFSLVNRFAWVCSNTPDHIPFFLGESYLPFIYTPIPRFLWAGKPIISDAIDLLDLTYDLKDQGSSASIGIGFIAEAYANFSWYGVIFVMAAQGLFLAFLDRVFNRTSSEGGATIFAVILSLILNGIGTSAVVIYGNMPAFFVIFILMFFPFCMRLIEPDAHVGAQRSGNGRGGRRLPAATRYPSNSIPMPGRGRERIV